MPVTIMKKGTKLVEKLPILTFGIEKSKFL